MGEWALKRCRLLWRESEYPGKMSGVTYFQTNPHKIWVLPAKEKRGEPCKTNQRNKFGE